MRILFLLLSFLVSASLFAQRPFATLGGRATLVLGEAPRPVMMSAAAMLMEDWSRVLGVPLDTARQILSRADATPRIVAAVAGDPILEGLGANTPALGGRREAFAMSVSSRGDLIIVGSDAHGVAYGLLEVSRMIGVSPWTWWAESVPQHKDLFTLPSDFSLVQAPSVEFRGIFINDEDWGLTPWAWQTHEPAEKGTIGPRTTERIFQLLLRLRANTYWPPMHSCSRPFFLTDGNREVADKYGIYVGSSHCEPMVCNANGEWHARGTGDYNFATNRQAVIDFWEDRVAAVACQEVIFTLGMRGIHDGPIEGAKTASERAALTQQVLDTQREMLVRRVNPDVKSVPQVFIPYKEVLDAYRDGMSVPDDVCLMWCDDNYGYIRHFPTDAEQSRAGGNGIYYHVSYWGRPHDYLWLGTFHPALMFQQMGKAFDHGVRRMWILNVGDIKPLEYQTELFLDMAWDINAVRKSGIEKHLQQFSKREFGITAFADVLLDNYNLAFERKPEHLGNTRTEEKDPAWKVVRDLPWSDDKILDRLSVCNRMVSQLQSLKSSVRAEQSDALFHLVEYPVLASAYMNQKMLGAQLARHGKAQWADVRRAESAIDSLTSIYNASADGKWRGMMNAAPRSLPVFQPAVESSCASLADVSAPVVSLSGADARRAESCRLCPQLGRQRRAAELVVGRSAEYVFSLPRDFGADSVVVELRFLPTHPVDESGKIQVQVALDGQSPVVLDYHTEGRSEEWKLNVFRNQAIRSVRFALRKARKHTLVVSPISEGVVLDEVLILKE